MDAIEEFTRQAGYANGSLQSLGNHTEPYSEVGYSSEETEYDAMRASVAKYGGFYIGRYEAGKENDKLVVKKGATVWNNILWGESMIDVGTNGAVYNSRNLYINTATIKDSVVSHLTYGVEWDAALKFIAETDSEYPRRSSGKGWYGDVSGFSVGNAGYYAVNNIYDMAGNVFEWTMEASTANYRVFRGGFYINAGNDIPASSRDQISPEGYMDYIGFRVSLYIK